MLLGGCYRDPDDVARDAGIDAGGSAYDPRIGSPFDGPVRFDDARVAAVDPTSLPAAPAPCREPVLARVTRDVDGDTVFVAGISETLSRSVRLIGVDTPEVGRDGAPSECWADEASAFTTALVGRTVWLTFDRECTDRFDRLLAYAWIGEGPQDLWQRQLLRRGHATTLAIAPNTHYETTLAEDELVARTAGAGLWSACR